MSESRRRMCVFNVLSDVLSDYNNPFGDEGLAALVAPPPAGATPQQVYTLGLSDTQITDDGCAYLASRLRSGALPALQFLHLYRTLASRAARDAVYKARPGLDG